MQLLVLIGGFLNFGCTFALLLLKLLEAIRLGGRFLDDAREVYEKEVCLHLFDHLLGSLNQLFFLIFYLLLVALDSRLFLQLAA